MHTRGLLLRLAPLVAAVAIVQLILGAALLAAPRAPRERAPGASAQSDAVLSSSGSGSRAAWPPSTTPAEPYHLVEPPAPPAHASQPAPEPQPIDGFARAFPAHAAARQVDGDPATFAWAVIVGVNDYAGRMDDTLGSVADATVLRDVLLAAGWRPDHVLVLADAQGSYALLQQALRWLERSTDERSTVVFSFSGHIRHRGGRTGLWAADNQILWSEEFGRLVGVVRAERMWISLQGCHAGAMGAAGVEGPNRTVTYSSKAAEKSYEDPDVGHSVQGNYLFAEGLRDRWGDADHDGRVSVQEAFAWAAPRAHTRTAGLQTPVLADGRGQPFFLELE